MARMSARGAAVLATSGSFRLGAGVVVGAWGGWGCGGASDEWRGLCDLLLQVLRRQPEQAIRELRGAAREERRGN